MMNITQFFQERLAELKTKIKELELILLDPTSGISEDADDYEKIVFCMNELYNYFISVSNRILQVDEEVSVLKSTFIGVYRAQGNRDVDKFFDDQHKELMKVDLLKGLDRIANIVKGPSK